MAASDDFGGSNHEAASPSVTLLFNGCAARGRKRPPSGIPEGGRLRRMIALKRSIIARATHRLSGHAAATQQHGNQYGKTDKRGG
jgi:hypothetical protein